MSEEKLISNFRQIVTAINYCIGENLVMPALVLIYAAIDSISWAASEDANQPVGQRFQKWVDQWMLKEHPLPCTALELYAARCAVLHTLTPDSNLTEKKNVRIIAYAWGTAKQADLAEAIKRLNRTDEVGLHINALSESFKDGYRDYIESLDLDVPKKTLFLQRAAKHFSHLDTSALNDFLDSTNP